VPTAAVIWSHDGQHVIFTASERNQTRVNSARLDGRETRALYEADLVREPFYLYGSPDDQHVAFLASDPLEGMQLHAPEHADARNAKASAYVRPHDLDVRRYLPGGAADAAGRSRGIVAQLSRAIVVGPIARLELIPADGNQPAGDSQDSIIEAQIPAQQYREMGFREGETLVVTPRRARVFVEGAA